MIKLLLLLLVMVAGECTDQSILDCFAGFIDLNGDDVMNRTEIENFLIHNECGQTFSKQWGNDLLSTCDLNGNDALDYDDTLGWQSCFRVIQYHAGLCIDCEICNNTLT